MKRIALIPITETSEGKYRYCIQKNNKLSSGTIDNARPALESSIRSATINIGYKHSPNFTVKKLIYTDTVNIFFVCIPMEMVDYKYRAMWISEEEFSQLDDFEMYIPEIIEKINIYKPTLVKINKKDIENDNTDKEQSTENA
jgi:hypothetical protein